MIAIKTKLCGFTTKETVDLAVANGVDFIGFVFCPTSPRNISPEKSGEISKNIPSKIKKVAVIVDAKNEEIQKIIHYLKPDFLQLHGEENVSRILEIKSIFKIPIIKAVKIVDEKDLAEVKIYEEVADLLMFDAHKAGSGKTFDWRILQNLQTKKDWFLSGGLNAENILEAIKATNTKMVDLSSGIEEKRGIKSPQLIIKFLNKIRSYL